MDSNNDIAEACLGLVRRGGPVLMRRGKSRGDLAAISAAELAAVRAEGIFVGFRTDVAGRVSTPGKKRRGPRSSAMIVNGTMAAAMAEYQALVNPPRGSQRAIAQKYGINQQTFATYWCSPARREFCMKFAR